MLDPKKIQPGKITRTRAVSRRALPVFAPRVIPADPNCNALNCKNPSEFMVSISSMGFKFLCTAHAFEMSETMQQSGKTPHDYLLKLHTFEEYEELRKKNEVKEPPVTPTD